MKLRPKSFDMTKLRLSAEEGFVLSRVDGPLTVRELVSLTGFEESRVQGIVDRLVSEGALDVEGGAPVPSAAPSAPEPSAVRARRPEPKEDELEEVIDDEEAPAPEESSPDATAAEAEELEDAEAEGNYRKIYETVYSVMERDARAAAAQRVDGAHLFALCLDPDPIVIHSVMTNPRVGLQHARAIAFHHRTHAGLEHVVKRTDFLADQGVQRRLLRNPQLPDTILRRIVSPKLIMDVYKICIDREIPERTRVKSAEQLRKRFTLASSEERAALVMKTEGRCLILLTGGCALDAHCTQILCAKTTYSVLFIQNLARWSATPPQLLQHLLKQPVVRRNMGLRKMLLKHPNVPYDIKRLFQA
jgi:hypothetical protein